MTKNDLIREIANRTGVTQGNVTSVLNTYADVVIDVLSENEKEKVILPNLGTFKIRSAAERKGKSPITGETWIKPAHKKLNFSLSSTVKEVIV